jgi:beta-phosphoglucomutase
VIFDFDGVILDSFPTQYSWFRKRCETEGVKFPYESQDDFKKVYQEPVYPWLYKKLGLNIRRDPQEIWDEYNAFVKKSDAPLFLNTDTALRTIHKNGFEMAICSGNTRDNVTRDLKRHRLLGCFDVIVTAEDLEVDGGERLYKPHPLGLMITLDMLAREPSEVIYVGDQKIDVEAAKRIADVRGSPIEVIMTTYGYSPEERIEELEKECLIAHNSREILKHLGFS